jgi:hypothetical protein
VANQPHQLPRRSWLIKLAAWWGHIIHKIPIELARRMALAQSTDEDEPAMYTMVYGLALTLVAYAIQILIVWKLFGGFGALCYFILLLTGAYWAAYAPPHRKHP